MVVPHYTYLVLKMPGPNGIITVKGSFELSDICNKEFHKMAQTFGTTVEYGEAKEGAGRNTQSTQIRSTPEKVIDNIPKAKKLWVHTKDPNNPTPHESKFLTLRRHFLLKGFSARNFELVKIRPLSHKL
jgi:hypothetical protein